MLASGRSPLDNIESAGSAAALTGNTTLLLPSCASYSRSLITSTGGDDDDAADYRSRLGYRSDGRLALIQAGRPVGRPSDRRRPSVGGAWQVRLATTKAAGSLCAPAGHSIDYRALSLAPAFCSRRRPRRFSPWSPLDQTPRRRGQRGVAGARRLLRHRPAPRSLVRRSAETSGRR